MPATSSPMGKALILVVEDEPTLRMVALDLVEEAGFNALEAADADQAIRVLESRTDIRLIFTDIDMPAGSMNGLRLAFSVRNRWPEIAIIMASGHYRAKQDDLPSGALFFEKPYPHREVVSAMRRMAA